VPLQFLTFHPGISLERRLGPSWQPDPRISDACAALNGVSEGLMERGKRFLVDML